MDTSSSQWNLKLESETENENELDGVEMIEESKTERNWSIEDMIEYASNMLDKHASFDSLPPSSVSPEVSIDELTEVIPYSFNATS